MRKNSSPKSTHNQSVADAVVFGVWSKMMITGTKISAARALLGCSGQELATRGGVSYSTVQRAELTDGVPTLKATNLFALQRTLEDGGVIFLDAGEIRPGGVGVRLKV